MYLVWHSSNTSLYKHLSLTVLLSGHASMMATWLLACNAGVFEGRQRWIILYSHAMATILDGETCRGLEWVKSDPKGEDDRLASLPRIPTPHLHPASPSLIPTPHPYPMSLPRIPTLHPYHASLPRIHSPLPNGIGGCISYKKVDFASMFPFQTSPILKINMLILLGIFPRCRCSIPLVQLCNITGVTCTPMRLLLSSCLQITLR